MVPRPLRFQSDTAYRFLAAFFAAFLAAGFFAAAFFAAFLAMAYTPFPGGVLWPAARRNLRALATLPLALTTREWRMSAAVRCGRRMAGGRRSRLAAAACPTDGRHQGGTRCGVALKRRSREPTTASSRPSSWPSERPSSPRPSWLPSSPFFLLGWRCSPREPSLAHHYRWIELPCLTQDVDYG